MTAKVLTEERLRNLEALVQIGIEGSVAGTELREAVVEIRRLRSGIQELIENPVSVESSTGVDYYVETHLLDDLLKEDPDAKH